MTACRSRVEVAEKLVLPGFQWADINGNLVAARDHLLTPQFGAFEFFRGRILIVDDESNFLARRDLDFGGLKSVVLDDQPIGWVLRRGIANETQNQDERQDG